jgi:hypothetical protein
MASTYQTNRGGAGGAGGSSEPYVQGVVIGDWTTSSTPGTQAKGYADFTPFQGGGYFPTSVETVTINGQTSPTFFYDFGISGFILTDIVGWINTTPSTGVTAFQNGDVIELTAINDGTSGNSILVSFNNFTQPIPFSTDGIVYVPTFSDNLDGGVDGIVDPDYTITIDAATHDKGTEPTATLYEEVGGIFEEVEAYVAIDATGNITIKVPVSPDGRFTGKIVVN